MISARERSFRIATYADQAQREEDPSLVVEEGFSNLIPLDDPILNTGLVTLEPRNDHQALVMGETAMSGRRVGKGVGEGDAPCRADRTNDQELVSPTLQRALDVTDAESDEAAQSHADSVEAEWKEESSTSRQDDTTGHAHLYQIEILNIEGELLALRRHLRYAGTCLNGCSYFKKPYSVSM